GRGGVTALSNGNYVAISPNWDNPVGPIVNVGAVTWCSGSAATTGLVTSGNSLTGGTVNDAVGSPGVTALSNGNYVIRSASWDNPVGPVTDAGAVTWGNGDGSTTGVVAASNSLVGGTANDQIGKDGITALTNGGYYVISFSWDNPAGPVVNANAVSFGNGAGITAGTISSA